MDLAEARSILNEIVEHDTPDAAAAVVTVLGVLDKSLIENHVRMNLALADGQRVDAWVRNEDVARLWHA